MTAGKAPPAARVALPSAGGGGAALDGRFLAHNRPSPTPPLTLPPPSNRFRPTLAGEAGFYSGAEGATAPETLRQKDRAG
jgi:hypothetical protein